MFLNRVNLRSLVLKQYFYKLKGYSGFVYGLIIAQIAALFFSQNPIGSVGAGTDGLSVSVKAYSADAVIILSLVWMLVISSWLPAKYYKDKEFSLAANRFSSNLSNIGFLMTCAVFAGLTSTLLGVLQRIIIYFRFDRALFMPEGFFTAPAELVLGIYAASLYMLLVAAAGYSIRVMVEVHKVFAILIPAVFMGLLRAYTGVVAGIFKFFVYEQSLLLFTFKILGASILLFGLSMLLSNRMEVRQ